MVIVPPLPRTFAALLADAASFTRPALGYPAIVAAYGSAVATAGGELKPQLVGTGTHSPVTVAIITTDDDADVISIAHSFFTYHRVLGAPSAGLDGRVYGIMGNAEGQLLPIELTDNAMSRVALTPTLTDQAALRLALPRCGDGSPPSPPCRRSGCCRPPRASCTGAPCRMVEPCRDARSVYRHLFL